MNTPAALSVGKQMLFQNNRIFAFSPLYKQNKKHRDHTLPKNYQLSFLGVTAKIIFFAVNPDFAGFNICE